MAGQPRYVLSERAANALRELIAPGAAYGSRPRRAADVALPTPRPFAVEVRLDENNALRLWCYLPPRAAYDVLLDGEAVPPAQGQAIGTAAAAWVNLAAFDAEKRLWLLVLYPGPASGGGTNPGEWSLVYQAAAPKVQLGRDGAVVPIAAWSALASDGTTPKLVQHHLGVVTLSDGREPCHPAYSLDEQTGSGCVEKTIVLKRTPYSRGSGGECKPGTPVIVGGGVAIPKPPEYTLSVAGSGCSRTITLQRTPCGGQTAPAGDTLTITDPPTISATSGSSTPGAVAGTVTVAPCGGAATTIEIRNGNDGALPSGSFEIVGDIYIESGYLRIKYDTYAFDAAGRLVFDSFRVANLLPVHTCGGD